jgi:hypothetical protein
VEDMLQLRDLLISRQVTAPSSDAADAHTQALPDPPLTRRWCACLRVGLARTIHS